MKIWKVAGLACSLLPLQALAANTQIALCKRGHFNFGFSSNPGAVGEPAIISIWLDGDEKEKKFGLGHVMKTSPNGDLMLLVSEPTKDKPGPGSVIVYTAGLHQAVLVADQDSDATTSVTIADCTIKTTPPKSKP